MKEELSRLVVSGKYSPLLQRTVGGGGGALGLAVDLPAS